MKTKLLKRLRNEHPVFYLTYQQMYKIGGRYFDTKKEALDYQRDCILYHIRPKPKSKIQIA